MSQFYSGADLKRGVLQRCGELADGTSSYEASALKYINQLYFNIIAGSNEFELDLGDPWIWARAPQPIIITLQPPYNTGTVNLTQGSASCSFSVAPSTSMVNQFLHVTDQTNPEKYRITAHVASQTSFTIDGPYNGSTNAAALFEILILCYPLADDKTLLRLVEPFTVYKMTFDEDRNYQIYGLDPDSFSANYPLASIVQGVPNRFTTFKDSLGMNYARFNEYASELTRVEVPYIPIPAELTDDDNSIPLIPREFRIALEYGATALLMLDKGDSRSDKFIALATQKLKALQKAERKEISHTNWKSKGRLFARPEFMRVRQRIQSFIRQTD